MVLQVLDSYLIFEGDSSRLIETLKKQRLIKIRKVAVELINRIKIANENQGNVKVSKGNKFRKKLLKRRTIKILRI